MKPVTSKGLQIIAIVTMLGVAAVLLIQRFGPFPRQTENIAAAEQHIEVLRPMLQRDPRFSNIVMHSHTAAGGSLLVYGQLFSDEALTDLKQIVVTSKPPVEVVYHVYLVPPELQDQIGKTNK